MRTKPRHLMISGNGDCDPHRISASQRGEDYSHVQEIPTSGSPLPYDIVYVDSSFEHRPPDFASVDVRAERLEWVYRNAGDNPTVLFVVVEDQECRPGVVSFGASWGDLLRDWPGRALPNVFFQKPDEPPDLRHFLAGPVAAWEALFVTPHE